MRSPLTRVSCCVVSLIPELLQRRTRGDERRGVAAEGAVVGGWLPDVGLALKQGQRHRQAVAAGRRGRTRAARSRCHSVGDIGPTAGRTRNPYPGLRSGAAPTRPWAIRARSASTRDRWRSATRCSRLPTPKSSGPHHALGRVVWGRGGRRGDDRRGASTDGPRRPEAGRSGAVRTRLGAHA